MAKSGKNTPLNFLFILGVLFLGFLICLFFLLEREKPSIEVNGELSLLGAQKKISFAVSDKKSGIRHFDVIVRQGKTEKKLYEQNFERQGYFSKAGPNHIDGQVNIDTTALGVKDGDAAIVFTAQDFSFWNLFKGNMVHRVFPITFDTQPPKVDRMDSPRYIKPGGAGIVIYKMSEKAVSHGVRINGYFHKGFPVSGKEGLYGATIALPYDTEKIGSAAVEAVDEAGNIGKAPFGMIFKKVIFKKDRINVPESFLDLKIPEFSQYYPEMTGNQLEKYLYVNNSVRLANNKKIMEICQNSIPEQLWHGRFNRMARSSNRAGYADHRTYYFGGQEVDKQVHLGIDLASTRHAQVTAANKGKVIYADYLGIYGNMVILDHGLGVFSLYSHMSTIDVKPGDLVEKGGILGATGKTGMAGGDHLHFSMLVNGIMVNPLEWWDESWLDLHILSYLK